MSKTDNTRPIDVVEQDRTTLCLSRSRVTITGGINSGKQHRKEATTRRRQHVRRVLRSALLLTQDPELIDIAPIRDDKRGVGWRHL